MSDDSYKDSIKRPAIDKNVYYVANDASRYTEKNTKDIIEESVLKLYSEGGYKHEFHERIEIYAENNDMSAIDAFNIIVKSIIEEDGEIRLPAKKLIKEEVK